MIISEIINKQEARDMFAVGRYQLILGTLKNAVNTLNLNPKLNFDEEVQDRIFNDYLIKVKRPAFINYAVEHLINCTLRLGAVQGPPGSITVCARPLRLTASNRPQTATVPLC